MNLLAGLMVAVLIIWALGCIVGFLATTNEQKKQKSRKEQTTNQQKEIQERVKTTEDKEGTSNLLKSVISNGVLITLILSFLGFFIIIIFITQPDSYNNTNINDTPYDNDALAYFEDGRKAYYENRYEDAIALFEKADNKGLENKIDIYSYLTWSYAHTDNKKKVSYYVNKGLNSYDIIRKPYENHNKFVLFLMSLTESMRFHQEEGRTAISNKTMEKVGEEDGLSTGEDEMRAVVNGKLKLDHL